MKKVITILLATFLTWSVVAAPDRTNGDARSSDIEEINVETVNDPGDERGGTAPVEAYLFHSTNTLYIALASSVGTATITVTDSFGTIVYTDVVDATLVGFTQFAAPTANGTYTLEIQSPTFYGIGTFNI